ncbi:transcription termination factor MTERF9, chloroplastic [Cryptomeria japonica]|uniref:transcription termination factor MTERF9, chloroplastic n=1 Tax=Cryptomeria japonica TaxID=3369 RepID=UPI0025AC0B5E|nr:transcription termination factor MTERF9, chloroplastic [Cryptomeria japonica]XP_057832413.1 transcription termination factor MTERF9, chloroplastic [Cryptomeria japonica]
MMISAKSPLHFNVATYPLTKKLSMPKTHLRFSPPTPPAYPVFSKLSLFCISVPEIQSHPEEEKDCTRESQHEDIEQYLVSECGILKYEVPKIMRKNRALFTSNFTGGTRQTLQLLRDAGFTPDQVRTIILKMPDIFQTLNTELRPKIELLKTLDLEDLGYAVSSQPRILTAELEKNLSPRIQVLVNLFGSKADLSKVIMKNPRILVSHERDVEDKFEFLESSGLLKDEIKVLLEKDPGVISVPMDQIQKKIDFLINTVGIHPNLVVRYPRFLRHSLDHKLKPRFKVIEYLNKVHPRRQPTVSWVSVFSYHEEKFIGRLKLESTEVAELYEQYKRDSFDVAVPKDNHLDQGS